jgi:hypothetical protein
MQSGEAADRKHCGNVFIKTVSLKEIELVCRFLNPGISRLTELPAPIRTAHDPRKKAAKAKI